MGVRYGLCITTDPLTSFILNDNFMYDCMEPAILMEPLDGCSVWSMYYH